MHWHSSECWLVSRNSSTLFEGGLRIVVSLLPGLTLLIHPGCDPEQNSFLNRNAVKGSKTLSDVVKTAPKHAFSTVAMNRAEFLH